jgi:hypothetical protein
VRVKRRLYMAVAAVKEKVEFNITDVLDGAATATVKKSTRSSVPVINAPDAIKQVVAEFRKLYEDLDTIKSNLEIKKATILQFAKSKFEELCKLTYTSSVRIPDSNGLSVTISQIDNWTKFPLTSDDPAEVLEIKKKHEEVKRILGNKYDDYMQEKLEISVRETAMTTETLNELIVAVGPQNFARFFAVKKTLKPNTRFTQERYAAFLKEERDILETLGVKCYECAVKPK